MKRVFYVLAVVIIALLLSVYLFIPGQLKVQEADSINAALPAVSRVLLKEENWQKWWPGETLLSLDDTKFSVTKKMLNSFEIMIEQNGDSLKSVLQFSQFKQYSINLIWNCTVVSGINPFQRIAGYFKARRIKNKLNTLTDSLHIFLSNQKNIYGFEIKKVLVTDSILISTRKTFDHYPSAIETEALIDNLRKYISANKAKEMNYPMLHVRELTYNQFEAMVAIATDVKLPDNNEFASKQLLKGGNLLEAEITGGHTSIRNFIMEYENFVRDFSISSPAIPYQLIITDRAKESDTSKWVTKLCYPVF